jgi:histidine triad (HIT) family protein
MASGEVAVPRVAENAHAFAIRDIHPRAPVHDLVIPFEHIEDARAVGPGHAAVLAGLVTLAREVAELEGVLESGYRLAFNVGDAAGMTVHHLHLHLLGGRQLGPEG